MILTLEHIQKEKEKAPKYTYHGNKSSFKDKKPITTSNSKVINEVNVTESFRCHYTYNAFTPT